jgi:hypothetical protein
MDKQAENESPYDAFGLMYTDQPEMVLVFPEPNMPIGILEPKDAPGEGLRDEQWHDRRHR